MTNPFTPSTVHPPVTPDYDPRAYGAVGADIPRGHRDFIMSRSELMRFAVNPWKWKNGGKINPTEAMEFGSLVDCLALTPHRFTSWYAIKPETYPESAPKKGQEAAQKPWNLNAAFCRTWEDKQRAEGRTPISRDFLLECRTAAAVFVGDSRIARLIACSQKQVLLHVEYHDKATGMVIQVKALPDLIPDPADKEYGQWQADAKTTNDASPDKWDRKVYDEDYHVQAAMHMDATNAAMGLNKSGFYHPIIEQKPPYAVGRRMLSEEFITLGRQTYLDALALYAQCLATGKWPGYDDINDNAAQPICDGWRAVQPTAWMI